MSDFKDIPGASEVTGEYWRIPTNPHRDAFSTLREELYKLVKDKPAKLSTEIIKIERRILNSGLGESLSDAEIEALTLVSLLVGTSEKVRSVTVGADKKSNQDKRSDAYKNSIYLQHTVVSLVLSNLDEQGNPRNEIGAYTALAISFIDDYYRGYEDCPNERCLMQGVLGMSASALMFHKLGCEVYFSPLDWDLKHDIDLIVKAPNGKVYGVDVTAKAVSERAVKGFESVFRVEKRNLNRLPQNEQMELSSKMDGIISVNVPPLWHPESDAFYKHRATGNPSEKAMKKLELGLKSQEILF